MNLKDVPNGDHLFAFTAGKAGNYSTPVTIKKWIGSDYPSAPANIVLTHEKVTWDPVTTSEHDGYVDYTSLKYTVTLNGRKMGETDGTECAITLPDQEPYKSYTAKIVATADGKASQPGESNYITHGNPLTIPEGSSIHFRPEEYEFEIFKAIDIDRKPTTMAIYATGISHRQWDSPPSLPGPMVKTFLYSPRYCLTIPTRHTSSKWRPG